MDVPTINDILSSQIERNFRVIQSQVNGLCHADSLLQPPFRGNCMNWIFGHVIMSRDRMLRVVHLEPVWMPEQWMRYERDSEPILSADDPDIILFEKMLADFAIVNERLASHVKCMTPADFEAVSPTVIKGANEASALHWLQFLVWHETYHVGQFEFLRQLAGKNDKII